MKFIYLGFLIFLSIIACEKFEPVAPSEDEVLDGPIDGLTEAELHRFLMGDAAFAETFTSQTGLGPTFVATSCASCHAGDGKGHPFTTLTRFGQSTPGFNSFIQQGGPQLQNRALPGYLPEQLPEGAGSSKFTPPANTGLGYLELVSDADIIAMTDPNDSNGDGISGVANWKNLPAYITAAPDAIEQSGRYIHRFGKKAAAYNLLHQTVNAYNQDMGITSVFEPIDPYTILAAEPEVDISTINNLVFYLQTLKVPIQRNQNDATVIAGKVLFEQINCSGCHKSTLRTGFSEVAALSNKEFYPYTDLLLHDMGADLDDGYTEGSAETAEWRTPPLWGLGLSPNSQGSAYFLMHDGRAQSIDAAILLHGGEASASKNAYQSLSDSDKAALLKFLESL